MRWFGIFCLRLRSLLARNTVESELDEELQYHLERQVEENIAGGMTAEDARYAALRSIEGLDQRKEECRDVRAVDMIDHAIQDLRYAIRQLRKQPGFALTVIFISGLGIAAAAAIFSLVQAALIRPLPYKNQDRLVSVFAGSRQNSRVSLSYLDFLDWQRSNQVFASLDAYALNGGFSLSTATGAEQVSGERVSPGFFRTLGVVPALGRDFRPIEAPQEIPEVVLSYAAWRQRFGGRSQVLGETITLNGSPRTIVGVLPLEFHFAPTGEAEFWTTLQSKDPCEHLRTCQNLNTVARLKDGLNLETASTAMQIVAKGIERQYPDTHRGLGSATLVPLRDLIVGDVRSILIMLLAGAGILLVIAYLNATTLVLARVENRRKEIAMRGALGATSKRLFQQFAVEGLVLAVAGGVLALILAEWCLRILISLVPDGRMNSMPWLLTVAIDPLTVTLIGSLSLAAAFLYAIVPAARISGSPSPEGINSSARGSSGTVWRRFGANLVVVEVGLAMVLMFGAALLAKSLYSLLHIDTGMTTERLAVVSLKWPLARYSSDRERTTLGRQVIEQVSALPGVQSVAISLATPVGSPWGNTSLLVSGRANAAEIKNVLYRPVSAGYFTTIQARLIRGRYFVEAEDKTKPRVAIVNRTLAARCFAGEDPIGKRIFHDWAPDKLMEIVGIVDDVKEGPLEAASFPVLYIPFNQNPVDWFAVLVRTSGDEQAVLASVGPALHNLDNDIAVSRVARMTQRIQESPVAFLHRSSAWLVGIFGSVAFVLGIVGLYGVVAYSVSHRTREIGIRMALGAQRGSVYQLILGEAMRLAGAGTALGMTGSLAATRITRGLFYGMQGWDVPMLAAVVAVVIVAALLASFVPARRGASISPTEALRFE